MSPAKRRRDTFFIDHRTDFHAGLGTGLSTDSRTGLGIGLGTDSRSGFGTGLGTDSRAGLGPVAVAIYGANTAVPSFRCISALIVASGVELGRSRTDPSTYATRKPVL